MLKKKLILFLSLSLFITNIPAAPIAALTTSTSKTIQNGSTNRVIHDSYFEYSINNDNTASVTKCIAPKNTCLKIPENITVNGKEIPVTLIDLTEPFSNSSTCSLVIGNCISHISDKSLQLISKFKDLKIYSEKNKIFEYSDGILYDKHTQKVLLCLAVTKGNVKIKDDYTSVAPHAFNNCNISSVDFPKSIKNISANTFENCSNLSEVIFHNPDIVLDSNAFNSTVPTNIRFLNTSDRSFDNADYCKVSLESEGDSYDRDYSETQFVKKGSSLIFNNSKYSLFPVKPCSTSELKNNVIKDYIINSDEKYYLQKKTISGIYNGFGYSINIDDFTTTASVCNYFQDIPIIFPDKIVDSTGVYDVTSVYASPYTHATEFIIPEGVKKIPSQAFYYCDAYKITLPSTINEIDDNAFSTCSVGIIDIPEDINLTKLNKGVFESSSFRNIHLPKKLETICEGAFKNSYTYDLTLSDSFKTFEPGALDGSRLEHFDVDQNNPYYDALDGILYNKSDNSIYQAPPFLKGNIRIKDGCENVSLDASLSSISLPDSVKILHLFNCHKLENISMPENYSPSSDSLKFTNCSALKDVYFPKKINHVYPNTFDKCKNLHHITFANGNVQIDKDFFINNSSPTNISFENTLSPAFNDDSYYKVTLKDNDYTETQFVKKGGNEVIFDSDKYDLYDEYGLVTSFIVDKEHSYTLRKKDSSDIKALDDYTYSLDNYNHTAAVTSYTGTDENIEIPDTIEIDGETYTVNEINSKAFYGSYISSVVIPESITSIGLESFSSCSNIKNITIPESVKRIHASAFSNCTSLESISLPEGIESIAPETFSSCSSLKEVVIPSTVKEIGSSSFANCTSLKSLTLPEGILSLDNILSSSSINTLNIPSTVSKISDDFFNDLHELTDINVDENNPVFESVDGVLYNKDRNTVVKCPENKEGTVEIKDSYETIAPDAFKNCKCSNIIMPNSIHNISIESCHNIKELRLPNDIYYTRLSIKDCINLTKLYIDDRYISLSNSNIIDCPNLEYIIGDNCNYCSFSFNPEDFYKVTLLSVDKQSVQCVKKGKDFIIDKNKYYVFDSNMNEIDNYSNDSDVTYKVIEKNNFYNSFLFTINPDDNTAEITAYWGNETNLEIPSEVISNNKAYTVTSIKDKAFAGSEIVSITIPDSVTNIGSEAFSSCRKLEKVVLPNNLKDIKTKTFYMCSKLKDINLPNNLVNIDSDAFQYCSSLEKIVLPSSVKKLDSRAFSDCTNLKDFVLNEGIESLGYRILNNTLVETLKIPSSATDVYKFFLEGAKMKNIEIDKDNPILEFNDGILYNNEKKLVLYCANKYNGDVVIKEGYELNYSSFQNCEFRSIKFLDSNSNPSISHCNNAEEITIKYNNYFSINTCKNLKAVTFDTNLFVNIYKSSIKYCPNLKYMFFNCTDAGFPCSLSEYNDRSLTNIQFVGTLCLCDDPEFYKVILRNADKDLTQYIRKGNELYIDSNKYYLLDENNNKVDNYSIDSNRTYKLVEKGKVFNDFTYSINSDGDTVSIKDYLGDNSNLEIPEEVTFNEKSYKVSKVDSTIFSNKNISSLSIFSNIECSGDDSFSKVLLKNAERDVVQYVKKGNELSIDTDKYYLLDENNNKVDNYSIDNDVTYKLLENGKVFNDFIYSINNDDNTAAIKGYIGNDTNLEIPKEVVFNDKSFKVTTIDKRAFEDFEQAEELSFPSTVSEINEDYFAGMDKLKNITVDKDNPNFESQDAVLYNKNSKKIITCIKNYEGSITIKDNYPEVTDDVFNGCSFSSLNLPEGVKNISLSNCNNIKRLTIPETVNSTHCINIHHCKNLECVTICGSISYSSYIKFLYCPNLVCVIFNKTVPNRLYYLDDFSKVTLEYCGEKSTEFVKKSSRLIVDADKYYVYDSRWKNLITDLTINYSQSYILKDKACDLNKDTSIDLEDLSLLASNYNRSSGDENFNEDYDVNKDGVCDIYDITKLSSLL